MIDDDILGKAYDARLMRRLLQYLRPYWRAVLVALRDSRRRGVAAGPPWLTLQVIDVYIPAGNWDGLRMVAALYLATLVADFVLEFVQSVTLQMTGQRIMFDLRMQIYEHLQRLDVRFYDRNPVGRLMTRVTSDVDALNELFTSGVVSVFGDVFALVAIMGALLMLDWRLALVAFSVIPLIALVTQWFRVNVRDTYREVRVWIARINTFLQENITGVSTVQLFRREARNFEQFDAINTAHMQANLRSIFFYAVFYPAIELLSALATALIIWFGGGRVMNDTLTLGTLVAFIQYASVSSARFRTCPRSSTSSRAPWHRPSASSSSWTLRSSSPVDRWMQALARAPAAAPAPHQLRRSARLRRHASALSMSGSLTTTKTTSCVTSHSRWSPVSESAS